MTAAPPVVLVAAMTQVRAKHVFVWSSERIQVCGCGNRVRGRVGHESHLSEVLALAAMVALDRRVSCG